MRNLIITLHTWHVSLLIWFSFFVCICRCVRKKRKYIYIYEQGTVLAARLRELSFKKSDKQTQALKPGYFDYDVSEACVRFAARGDLRGIQEWDTSVHTTGPGKHQQQTLLTECGETESSRSLWDDHQSRRAANQQKHTFFFFLLSKRNKALIHRSTQRREMNRLTQTMHLCLSLSGITVDFYPPLLRMFAIKKCMKGYVLLWLVYIIRESGAAVRCDVQTMSKQLKSLYCNCW